MTEYIATPSWRTFTGIFAAACTPSEWNTISASAVTRAISALKSAAEGAANVLYPLRDALRADATLGEVCDALRDVWGEYQPGDI